MSILPALISHLSYEVLSRQQLREASKNPEFSEHLDLIPIYFRRLAKKQKSGLERPRQFLKRLVRPGVKKVIFGPSP